MDTVWVLGDQLNRSIGALSGLAPGQARVLMVESAGKLGSKPFHRQRLHLVLASMRRFADELRTAGFEVDHRCADSLAAGLATHRQMFQPGRVVATEPLSWDSRALLQRLDVELVRSNQFLCHSDEFAAWADGQGAKRLRMEDFYRWQRKRLGYLMDGDEPAGGRWNFDHDNRRPPQRGGRVWPRPVQSRLDALDRAVLGDLPSGSVGEDPQGWWPTSRRAALIRLRHVVDDVLADFGPHEDAMLARNWHLAHSLLSPALNIGLLLPGEVCDAAEAAYRKGRVPIASAEGFIRQIIGWREYVWGLYWRWMPGYRERNHLEAQRALPPVFRGEAATEMRCLATTLAGVQERGWVHHIQRLMVLSNLAMLAAVRPQDMVDWMWASFVDGSEWVMLPNVLGMGLWADGGAMATKPYAAGGAYINRMSDYCSDCRFDPKKRTGDDACPYTTLYWDFIARHQAEFAGNHRMAQPVRGFGRLDDRNEVRQRAAEVLSRLDRGEL